MSSRRFGIEIECGMDIAAAKIEDEGLRKALAAEMNRTQWIVKALLWSNKNVGTYKHWADHVGHDGTFAEVRSPVLKGDRGFWEIHQVMDLLRTIGGYTTDSDGMHIHIDAPEYVNDVQAVFRLVKTWKENQHFIHSFVASRRRPGGARHPSCREWPDPNVEKLEEYVKNGGKRVIVTPATYDSYYGSTPERRQEVSDFKHDPQGWGRNDLNIRALNEHKSIEIRLHQGILDPDRAEAWIKFGQAMLDACAERKRVIKKLSSREELLERISVPAKARNTLLEFASKE